MYCDILVENSFYFVKALIGASNNKENIAVMIYHIFVIKIYKFLYCP